jgi:monofunctional biosynthetic peptidoglycan transglycosylase
VTLASGLLGAELDADLSADLSRAEARVRVTGEDVRIAGDRIAEEPLGPFRATAAGTLVWDATERRLAFKDLALAVADALRVDVSGELRLGAGVPFRVALRADDVDYAALVDALPPVLRPPEGAPRGRGTLDARLDAEGPLLAPAAWRLDAALDLSRMRAASRSLPGNPLRMPFLHTPDLPGAHPFEVGPKNPDFVPLAELPPYVIRAVTASEDAGFFAHHGFDFAELADAFTAGAERGRVVRGGSTITQQLAKNIYLSGERTIARKLREAAITIALEATVPKSRLLEIYLNIAEWGPGVFGIGAAAHHWFGKDARALTPKEAAFLASVIPNPVRFDGMRARGAPSAAWEQRVQEILLRMSNQGALGPDELLRALAEPIVFAHG